MAHRRQDPIAQWAAALATGGVALLGLALLTSPRGRAERPRPASAGDRHHRAQAGHRLGTILVKRRRFIGPEELARALLKQQTAHKRLGETLIDLGLITRDQLTDALIEQQGSADPWRDAVG